MKSKVSIVEVGPRDGLQNEIAFIPTETKIRFVDALVAAGHRRVEVSAFVNPKLIPALRDAEEVFAGIRKVDGVRFTALVPNLRGLDSAMACGVNEVAVFTAASEEFNQRNINASIEESFERFAPVLAEALSRGMSVRGYVSTALHCPYEGPIPVSRTLDVTKRLLEMGCYEVSLGDTVGVATPSDVDTLCRHLAEEDLIERCAGHFHDTYNMAIANVWTAWKWGMSVFDSSAGGLGGCPFAPGAAGNVGTEDLVYLFERSGVQTGIDMQKQIEASTIVGKSLDRELPSKVYRAIAGRAAPFPTSSALRA